ncbi:MAG: hypothetical protein A2Y17_09240 [Clostridiales bacterium GWF2_38_85]|nr:MAG: hypothetical protein A2Y17_09240 [Clostridiales bacterium GWF2_38_85]HBL83618.1 YraN family protein [Clostridiales bacterium]
MNTKEFGRAGEKAAADYLKQKEYRILGTNYLTAHGEIDIIAYNKGRLVFVEVKTRSNDSYGAPMDAVDLKKIQRVLYSAEEFKTMHCRYGHIRLDCSFLCFRWTKKLRYTETGYDIIEVFMTRDLQLEKIEQHINAFNKNTPNKIIKTKKSRYKY